MRRTGLFVAAGLLLGVAIHVAVVLMVPLFASHDAWAAVGALGIDETFHLMPASKPGESGGEGDPDVVQAVCRFDLSNGPVRILATLPDSFWSVGLFDRRGRNLYSLNHTAMTQPHLDLTVATSAEAAALPTGADQNALIAAWPENLGMAVLRAFVPDEASRPALTTALAAAQCNAPG
jgi:uncharacterized membrane protein